MLVRTGRKAKETHPQSDVDEELFLVPVLQRGN